MNVLRSHINIKIKSKNNNSSNLRSLHNDISFILILAQFFALMPLYGIYGEDYHSIKFKWRSLRYVYTVINIIGAFTFGIFCCLQLFLIGFMIDKTATLTFYICNFFGALYFVRVARNWNYLMREWSKVESSMKKYGDLVNLKVRFKIMTGVALSLALVEHILFVLNALNSTWSCEYQTNEVYFSFAFPQIFSIISFSPWKAVLVQITNILATFCWNFIDLFIMLLSSALALRFQQVSNLVHANSIGCESFWKKVREDYNRLSFLCAILDKCIGPLIVISFTSNIFFICIQLYNSLKPRYGIIQTIYFFYSFGFLLARTIAVSIYAAWINDESREPLKVLHCVPSENFCVEIERFIQQIHTSPNGITGSKFFLISRSFIMKIAGTIVTFELMLLQFSPLLNEDFHIKNNHKLENMYGCKLI